MAGDATPPKAVAAVGRTPVGRTPWVRTPVGQDPAALACSSAICLRAAATSSSLVFA